MKDILMGLQPEAVFRNFEKLTRIPRESGNEEAVADFLVSFAKKLNLEVTKEDCGNVIIKKPAASGYEKSPVVILQGHTDIVCVKLDDYEFDFTKDAIPLLVEGDFVKTEGTTLGADNGIAVAMAMSILEDKDLQHPELVCLFTVGEETGMDGVVSLNPQNVRGDILINIDAEEEGTVLTSCAGGVNNILEYPVRREKRSLDECYRLVIQGLAGGHSGIEINKNRANALKLMGRILKAFEGHFPFELISINGGEKMNAIAKRAEVVFAIDNKDVDTMEMLVGSLQNTFSNEFEISDPNIELVLKEEYATIENSFIRAANTDIANILRLIPYGIQTMSAGMPGLVESSSNLGVLEERNGSLRFVSAVRSSVKSLKHEINERFEIIAKLTGCKNYLESDYPEWQFKQESYIRDVMRSVYSELYNKELHVDAIHAGLECGFLKEKVGDIDMISIGPNLYDVHTPYEKLSISSTKRVYEFLCEVLKRLK